MEQKHNIHFQEETEFQRNINLITNNYKLFIIGVVTAVAIAFAINRYTIPKYAASTSILIREDQQQQNMTDALSANLFGNNKNLQNELLSVQSSPILTQIIKNLDLPIRYYRKKGFQFIDEYKNVPFRVLYAHNHTQPLFTHFEITFISDKNFTLKAEGKDVYLYNLEQNKVIDQKGEWSFNYEGKVGQLIENKDLSFIIEVDSVLSYQLKENQTYYFDFANVGSLIGELGSSLDFVIPDKKATAIQINIKTTSYAKGVDVLNELTNVYANFNLEKKNHLAEITIDYIDKQLSEISDSLNRTEQKLQNFRSSNQLLNLQEKSSGIYSQFTVLQDKRAELTTYKRYYENVLNTISKNEDFSNLITPSLMGIQDPLNNSLMSELISAQSQKNLLIENNQEKSPIIKTLNIKIDNLRKTINDNIVNALQTNDISLDEVNKRINRLQAEISRMPNTERQLTGIERNYRLTDAINNFLAEKRANANITKASNLPDIEVIEPAGGSSRPISPNKRLNYIIAIFLGFALPLLFIQLKSSLSNKLESQDQIEKITDIPVLGKILHNSKKSKNVVFEMPSSSIAEAYRTLRTNLEYYVRGGHKKVIMVTSSIEGEGKSFNALNIAMSYAQLERKTILIDFDLRKHSSYFNDQGESLVGMSSYLINKANLEDIIIHSPHPKLDYISSGPIPPNPVELIGLEKTEKMITHLKGIYDYIIIDTPPLAQVTDGYLLIEQADIKIIIARYNYTVKKIFTFIIRDLIQKGIGNVCIVLNDNRAFRDQYGYGYGYTKKS